MISCSLGDDNVTFFEDTCNFTCNTGYKLTGSDTRSCQSDGSWSGSSSSCVIMNCSTSSLPMEIILPESCSNTYQSMCQLQCQKDYESTGDSLYVCDVANGSSVMWIPIGDPLICEGYLYTYTWCEYLVHSIVTYYIIII